MTRDVPLDESRPQRSIWRRLAHTIAEVALSFLFAGAVFMMSVKLMCLNNYSCNDFGGVAFFVAGLLIAMLTWGLFLSLCKRFHDRPKARMRFDLSAVAVTVGLCIAYFLMM